MKARELAERFGYKFGCSDTCRFGTPGGQHTNGGCRCIPRGLSASNVTEDELTTMRLMIINLAALLTDIAKELPDDFRK